MKYWYDPPAMPELFISFIQTDPRYFFAVLITVVVSITLHELAHGWVAILHGDDTPLYNKQMTLNPMAHIPPMSWILFALMGLMWGRMFVDPTRMRGKYADAWVAAAGPATNVVLSAVAMVGLGLWERFDPLTAQTPQMAVNGKYLLLIFSYFNILLAIFNMLPIPPLDGSRILSNLSRGYARFLEQPMAQGIMLAVFFGLMMGGGEFMWKWAINATFTTLAFISGQSEGHFYFVHYPETLKQ